MSRFVLNYHKAILGIAIALTLVAVYLASHLRLDPNFFSLLPTQNPSVKAFFTIADQIGFQSKLVAMVERSDRLDTRAAEDFVETFARRLEASPLIKAAAYRTPEVDWTGMLDRLLAHLPRLLTAQEMDRLADKLSDQAIVKQVQINRQLLMTPMGSASERLIASDPLGIREVIEPRRRKGSDTQSLQPVVAGKYRSTDERLFLIFITPTQPPQNIPFSKQLMETVYRLEKSAIDEADVRWRDLSDGIKVHYTGGYPIAINDEATTKKDIKVTIITSFIGVMILFALAFGTLRILVYVGLPLICSLLWTVGFGVVVFGSLNVLTCIFACVLIGLGVDFGIHFINRYFDPENKSLAPERRLQQTYKEAGMGIVIGGITTAAAFYAISISDFRGFHELGIMTGTGLLFGIVAMTVFLPALLVFLAGRSQRHLQISIAGFGLKTTLPCVQKSSRTTLMIAGFAVVGLTWAGLGVTFDDNLKNFRAVDNETLRLQAKVRDQMGGSIGTILLVNHGDSENQVWETEVTTYEALLKLQKAGQIASIKALSQYLPSPEQQRRNLDRIRQKAEKFDINRIQRTFNQIMRNEGFRVNGLYDTYFQALAHAFTSQDILFPSTLQSMGLPDLLKGFILDQEGGLMRTVIYVQPVNDLWLRDEVRQFKASLQQTFSTAGLSNNRYTITGANLLTGELKDLILKNLRTSLGLACISILVVLILYYRSLTAVLLALVPLIASLAALSGIMAVLRIEYNFLNIMIIPMVVGIGLDDGVHFTNTFRQTDYARLPDGLLRTGRAIVLTSLTTLIGFGSIMLSHYPGLKSMGYVAVIGITACLISSLIILPPLFHILSRYRKSY